MPLRWEQQLDGVWQAYQGDITVGFIVARDDGKFRYDASTAVFMRWIANGQGEAKSLQSAKLAVEQAWDAWLKRTGLVQLAQYVEDPDAVAALARTSFSSHHAENQLEQLKQLGFRMVKQ